MPGLIVTLGSRNALSPIVWLILLPLHIVGAYFVSRPVDQRLADTLSAVPILLVALLPKAIILEAARRTIGGYLRGRRIDAAIVAIVWFVSVAAGTATYTAVLPRVWGVEPDYLQGWGWLATSYVEQLAIAVAVSANLELRARLSLSTSASRAATRALLAARIRHRRLVALIDEGVVKRLSPGIARLRRELPASTAPHADLRVWARGAADFATHEVRDLSHQIAALNAAPDGSLGDLESRLSATRSVGSRRRLFAYLRLYPRVHPFSYLPGLIMLPVLLQELTNAGPPQWIAMLILAVAYGIAFTLLMRIVRTGAYQRLSSPAQWLFVLLCQVGLGYAIWPLGVLLGTPSVTVFGNFDRAEQAAALTFIFVVFSLAVGSVVMSLTRRATLSATYDSLRILDENEAVALRLGDDEAASEAVSQLHGPFQGRLVALSMLVDDACVGNRNTADTLEVVNLELTTLSRELESLHVSIESATELTSPLCGQALSSVINTWRRLITVEINVSDQVAEMEVAAELAESVARVLGEGIANAVCHANATRCDLAISASSMQMETDPQLEIVVASDGAPPAGKLSRGLGLDFVEAVSGGRWDLEAGPSGGSILIVTLGPVPQPGTASNETSEGGR